MQTDSLFDQACAEREIAQRDWDAANDALATLCWNQPPYHAAIDARLVAAKRWLAADRKRIGALGE